MGAIALTKENFDETIGKGKALVDFWAGWCMPCRMVSPVIDELAAEYEGRVIIAKVDVDSEGGLASRYSIMNIPTVILFVDGKEAKRFIGVKSKAEYAAVLGAD